MIVKNTIFTKMVPVKTCCIVFNLRQGTMLIGMVQLLLSAFGLFLLVLAISHAREMTGLLAADMEEQDGIGSHHLFATQWGDAAFRHGAHDEQEEEELKTNEIGVDWKGHHSTHPATPTEENTHVVESSPSHRHHDINRQHFYHDSHGAIIKSISNQGQLHRAEHLAMAVVILMYTAVALLSIHLVSCILLLYGTYTRIRQLMLPWLSIVLMGLAFDLTSLFVTAYYVTAQMAKTVFALGMLQLMLGFYLWIVVFSYYRQLFENEMVLLTVSNRGTGRVDGLVGPNMEGNNTVVVLGHPPGYHQHQIRGWPWGAHDITTTMPVNGSNLIPGGFPDIPPNRDGKMYNV